ncbi:MAG: SusD/RagB family nutrient-binding outer membrane lipoprotein [Salibacter sp.]|uniref:SusD/RagB family nutrient-binding outer membrane lipoprotein n=1 Tax=Salibacter sp. TaxID=2010995 RepID=UPI0028704A15|nr:SusD/RagB family nutrient-binding outer membrane lipoprotein [Salibacter sp.]MDR9397838.1 SusD/RagB family nutrient-binding outer membrane lipoprotein [Salibacter sp.]
MKMKYLNPIIIFTLFVGISIFVSCNKDFDDINENPNEPTEVSPDVLLASAIKQSVNTSTNESFLLGNNAGQLTAKTLRTEVDDYNWNAFPTVWSGFYTSLTDVESMIDITYDLETSTTKYDRMRGVGLVLRSWIYYNITNAYGDVPYFNAIEGDNGNFTPAYDSQSEIYADMIEKLDQADSLLQTSYNNSDIEVEPITGDLIYNNDASKWVKFANSLQLRILMHAGNRIANGSQKFEDIVNNRPIISSNDDNATLDYLGGFPNQFPTIPLKTGDFDAVALSQNAYATLSAYGDPRLMRYARPSNGNYDSTGVTSFSGAVNGRNNDNCNKSGSRLGAIYYNYPDQKTASSLGLETANGLMMTYAEVQFILAEAQAKGWINTGTVEGYYKEGILASMEQYQVNVTSAGSYSTFGYSDFDDFYNNSGVAYNAVTDIWEQKWLALFFTGLEPYFEVRRWYVESNKDWNNIPFLSAPCDNVNGDALPMRFLYPGEEQSLNSANYNNALPPGGDDINNPMWLVE